MKNTAQSGRLASLDALRGFDMFWIMGGDGLFIALASVTGWPVLRWWAVQMEHVPWHGFHFFDMTFPLFLFIAGISFPYSVRHRATDPHSLLWHLLRRGLSLVLLGIIYNNAIRFNISDMRFASVLGRIGLAWMLAGMLWLYLIRRWRIPAVVAILLGYWGLMELFHVPGLNPYSMEGSMAGLVDRALLPGKLYLGVHDPEGLAGIIPAVATAMLGMITGQAVMQTERKNFTRLSLILLLWGVALLVSGWIWHLVMPVNKNLWTSSFVLVAGGLSMILFSVFFWLIDVKGLHAWAFPFRIIGMNAIAIYLGQRLFSLSYTSDFLFGGITAMAGDLWKPLFSAIFYVLTCWLLLYFFYRNKLFFKV